MEIRPVLQNKKQYIDLLLLADEQEDMIDKYLEKGDMYVLLDPNPVAECVVVDLGEGVFEIKSLATDPSAQGKGYGKKLIRFALDAYKGKGHTLLVGTGDSPLTVPFYERCGFREHHRVKDFFTDNYDHPIIEAGVQLVDMVYLSQPL